MEEIKKNIVYAHNKATIWIGEALKSDTLEEREKAACLREYGEFTENAARVLNTMY